VLWGTGGIAGSLLIDAGAHPLGTASYRALGGGIVALLLAVLLGRTAAVPRTAAAFRRLGACGPLLALFQAGYFASVSLTSVTVATLVTIGSVPIFVTAATSVAQRRLPGLRLTAAVGAAVIGLALLVGTPTPAAAPGQTAAGMACALAAGAGFAAMTVINRRPAPGLDPLTLTAWTLVTGGLILAPLGLAAGMSFTPAPSSVGVLAFLCLVPTAIAYSAYFGGLRSAPATAAALVVVLEPLTAAILGAVFLGEVLGPLGLTGAFLLLGALALASRHGVSTRRKGRA
jgi:drug/metabolite transporter, DME family